MLVHRREWEAVNGPIPDGMTIDHLCRVKLCINVGHMEVVTRSENSKRAIRAMTHCKRGHELSGENLRLTSRKTGRVHRVCRQCASDYNREWMRKWRDAHVLVPRPDVREWIKSAGLTISETAEAVGLTQQGLSRRIAGETPMRDDELARIRSVVELVAGAA